MMWTRWFGLAAVALVITACAPQVAVPTLSTTASGPKTYVSDDFKFDYPADWRVLAERITARHYESIPAVVGTGDWKLNCETTVMAGGTETACGPDLFFVDPGDVVVEMHSRDSPAHIEQSPPPDGVEMASGLVASVTERGTRVTWAIYGIPGWRPPLLVEAEFGPEPGPDSRAQVEALVDSIALLRPPGMSVPVPTQTADANAICGTPATGNLIGNDEWGIAFWDDDDIIRKAVWPFGYAGRIEPDGRLALIDAKASVVAYEHDLVDIDGAYVEDVWQICAIRLRTYPSH